jgi:hypothetical protein
LPASDNLRDSKQTMSANEMTGGETFARMVQAHEGGPMFGMGSFQLLPFYDVARRLDLAHHLINDERAGVFAADAYAKGLGRVAQPHGGGQERRPGRVRRVRIPSTRRPRRLWRGRPLGWPEGGGER